MYIREPFKNAVDPYSSKTPVVAAIAVEDDCMKILFRAVGSIRNLQYNDIVDSRLWRHEGFTCRYKTGFDAFSEQATEENGLGLNMNDFVMTVEGTDLEKVLNIFTKLGIITTEQSQLSSQEFRPL